MTTKIQELQGAMFYTALLMSVDYRLRDNDYLLCKAYEAIELKKIKMSKANWKVKLIKYIDKLVKNPLTPPETISRSRRIIQYEKGLLLGDRAIARKEAAEAIRNQIKDL